MPGGMARVVHDGLSQQPPGLLGEPADEADQGRHPSFAPREDFAGGPGSLSLTFAYNSNLDIMTF